MLNARALQRLRCAVAKIARLGPEILEICGIAIDDAVDQRSEHARIAKRDLLEIEPGAWREAEAGHLEQRFVFLLIEARIHVAAAARIERIDDLRKFWAQNAHRMRLNREEVGNTNGRAMDKRDGAIPHAGNVLDAAERFEGPAAAAIHVPVWTMFAVHFRRERARIFGHRRI